MPNISGKAAKQIIKGALLKENVEPQAAEYVAEGLTSTSLRGVDSHGIRLIHHYLAGVKSGRINPRPVYRVEKKLPTTALLDADNTFGHAAGQEAVKIAMEMAAEYGSGQVAIKNSTHFGAAAYFALEIASHDMIGTSYTHSDSLIIPTNGKRSYLGNNPVCFAAPVKGEGPFCLDMATSIITFNAVRRLREMGEAAPENVGTDKDGIPTTDPNEITMLLPVGSYKGYGLSLMVEILCSMLTGMNYGSHISKMFENIDQKRHLGHFISATNISGFQEIDTFKERLAGLLNELRSEPPLNAEQGVMVAGDPEKKKYLSRGQDGIPLTDNEFQQFRDLNQDYQLDVEIDCG
ncbi:MAG TPA: Ldh family oxidoreductase [Desulfobacterales bacterium]|nr:Ldh family oxidoreductase [Desulfobacterales bacterium]